MWSVVDKNEKMCFSSSKATSDKNDEFDDRKCYWWHSCFFKTTTAKQNHCGFNTAAAQQARQLSTLVISGENGLTTTATTTTTTVTKQQQKCHKHVKNNYISSICSDYNTKDLCFYPINWVWIRMFQYTKIYPKKTLRANKYTSIKNNI